MRGVMGMKTLAKRALPGAVLGIIAFSLAAWTGSPRRPASSDDIEASRIFVETVSWPISSVLSETIRSVRAALPGWPGEHAVDLGLLVLNGALWSLVLVSVARAVVTFVQRAFRS
jgi:hypothetical protein